MPDTYAQVLEAANERFQHGAEAVVGKAWVRIVERCHFCHHVGTGFNSVKQIADAHEHRQEFVGSATKRQAQRNKGSALAKQMQRLLAFEDSRT